LVDTHDLKRSLDETPSIDAANKSLEYRAKDGCDHTRGSSECLRHSRLPAHGRIVPGVFAAVAYKQMLRAELVLRE
jgi:siroheme synthase